MAPPGEGGNYNAGGTGLAGMGGDTVSVPLPEDSAPGRQPASHKKRGAMS